MKTKHTKGEWEVNHCDRGLLIESVDDTVSIATVTVFIEAQEEQIANAKLIAAAPDLLELAYHMQDVMDHLIGRMGNQMEIEVNNFIEKTIKKAI